MKQIVLLLAISFITHAVNAGEAASTEPVEQGQVVDHRQERQDNRIQKGVENGSLTEAEAKKLSLQQKRIQKKEDRVNADGAVSAQEKKRLTHAQNNAHRDIKRKKNNKRTR